MARSLLAFAALLPFLSSCSRSDSSPSDEGYIAPFPAGWQEIEPGAKGYDERSTTFARKIKNTKLRMRFTVAPVSDSAKAPDIAELKRHAQSDIAKTKVTAPTLQILEQKETTFRGFPAYLTVIFDRDRGFDRERKVLRVTDGKHLFSFKQTLKGDPIDVSARSEADATWNKFSTKLQLPTSHGA